MWLFQKGINLSKLIVSFNGKEYKEELEKYIEKTNPYGLIFFSKNIDGEKQLKDLTFSIKRNFPSVKLAIDMEGGVVNRLRKIVGDLPIPEKGKNFLDFGKKIGSILKKYGFDIDFAPVVDIDRGVKGNGLDTRYLGKSAGEVIEKAGLFLEGLESEGITGCIKHYIGLAHTKADSHYKLPSIQSIEEEDELPFRALSNEKRMIMIAHINIKDYGLSTYSKRLIKRLKSFHNGLVLSDDLGMKALSGYSLKDKLIRTFNAGVDIAIITDMITDFSVEDLTSL